MASEVRRSDAVVRERRVGSPVVGNGEQSSLSSGDDNRADPQADWGKISCGETGNKVVCRRVTTNRADPQADWGEISCGETGNEVVCQRVNDRINKQSSTLPGENPCGKQGTKYPVVAWMNRIRETGQRRAGEARTLLRLSCYLFSYFGSQVMLMPRRRNTFSST